MKQSKRTLKGKRGIGTLQYFYLWISCILVFYFSILLAGGNFYTAPGILVFICLLSVLAGGLIFLMLIVSIFKEKDWKILGLSAGVFLLFFMILFSLPNADLSKSQGKIDQSNPLVDCNLHEKCGGGTKRMTQSECVNSTCCQIGKVNITIDKDECKLKQQEYTDSTKPAPATNIRIQQPIRIPTIKPIEAPMCCKESCNNFTGTCTTRCERSWVCY